MLSGSCVISGFGGTVLGSKVWPFHAVYRTPRPLLGRLQTQRLGGTEVGSIRRATWPSKSRARLPWLGSSAYFLVPAIFMAGTTGKWPLASPNSQRGTRHGAHSSVGQHPEPPGADWLPRARADLLLQLPGAIVIACSLGCKLPPLLPGTHRRTLHVPCLKAARLGASDISMHPKVCDPCAQPCPRVKPADLAGSRLG